jgi:methyl-accepting chemotaxis protein
MAEAQASLREYDSSDDLGGLVEDLEAMQKKFAHNGELLLEVIQGVDQNYLASVERLSRALGSIQFYDVMRQRLEHVQAALRQMCDHLLRLSQDCDRPGCEDMFKTTFKEILAGQVEGYRMASQTLTHHAVVGGEANLDLSRPAIELF